MSITTNKPNAAAKLREALALNPASTAAQLAEISGLNRATINKQLTALKHAGHATTTEGSRNGRRGRPATRWSLTGQTERPRLRPGELDGLVLTYLRGLDAPIGPTAVGKALDRSAGAVANCMARLAKAGQLKQTSDRPCRYESLASVSRRESCRVLSS
jgi:predicted ArsR family transcriptional regulator